jgi:hypothetical protein
MRVLKLTLVCHMHLATFFQPDEIPALILYYHDFFKVKCNFFLNIEKHGYYFAFALMTLSFHKGSTRMSISFFKDESHFFRSFLMEINI